MVVGTANLLSQETLERFAERAPIYDRENRFFIEDFEELRKSGYLLSAVPEKFGGRGLSLAEMAQEQRRLAYYAAPTALAVNMHIYWTGVFADVWRAGDTSVEPFLEEAGAGEIFAAGHAEPGNDLPLLLSTSKAERVDGGYRVTGRKSFGSLTPVWTRLGIHAMDTSDPTGPKIIHAFMPRGTAGSSIVETWDVLGMRATRSDDTVLDGVFIPDRYIGRVVPAGGAGIDHFVIALFAWALIGFGNVYYGLAHRAADLLIENVKSRKSIALSRSMAYHPEIQHGIAQMIIDLEGVGPHLDRIAEDWSNHVDYGPAWGLKIVAAKHHAVEASWRVVDQAMELAGGFGIFKTGPFERLWRDARLGRIHPANNMLTMELVGKTALGIDPDEQPRWG